MANHNRTRPLAIVKHEAIDYVAAESPGAIALHNEVFKRNEHLALHIRARAIELGGDDLDVREKIATVALEAVKMQTRQADIDTLEQQLGLAPAAEPQLIDPDTLPPAA